VALIDMALWHWMYDHPNAKPAELKEATIQISKDIWNKYYATVFNKKDVALLGVYSHIIHSFLYLPDYPLGHLIALQIEEQVKKGGTVGSEVERMTVLGNVTPDVWMKNATGRPVGAEAMLAATERSLEELAKAKK
jgi:oligoendopeptidase F